MFPFDPRHHDESFSSLSQLEQSQAVMLRMLKVFVEICERHEIIYVLMFGTLLGAYRHQGFIPWDGDIDVGVRAEDLPRLKEILMAEIPNDMFFQDSNTDHLYPFDLAKLRDRFSNFSEWAKNNPQYRYHNGLQVDLFAYHLLPDGVTRFCPFRTHERFIAADLFPATFEDGEKLTFCEQQMAVPPNYLTVLKLIYKTLEIPPKDQQVPHEGTVDIFHPCKHPESLEWKYNAPLQMPVLSYYINLDDRIDRKKAFEAQSHGFQNVFSFHRISAIKNQNGALGCAISHVKTLRHHYATQINQPCVIFEDDFRITVSEHEMSVALQRFLTHRRPSDAELSNIHWDVLLLNASIYDFLLHANQDFETAHFKRVRASQSAAGYMVRYDYIPTLIQCFEKSVEEMTNGAAVETWAIDQHWKNLMIDDAFYLLYPTLGVQGDGYSDIEQKNVAYRFL